MADYMVTTAKEEKQNMELINGIITANNFIEKKYLINLAAESVVPMPENIKNPGDIRLMKIGKIIYDRNENVNDKLISVYGALQDIDSSALMLIDGDGEGVSFYIGTCSSNAAVAARILRKSFLGNFPGSSLINLKNSEINIMMNKIVQSANVNTPRNVSCVTIVPSTRDEDKDRFVQGIEKFIDTMQGDKFSALFLARPVKKQELEQVKKGYEQLATTISPFLKTSLAYGKNFSKAVTEGMFQNFAHSINNSVTNTTGRSETYSTSETYTHTDSSSFGGGFSSSGSSYNYNFGSSDSYGTTSGYSSGRNWSKSVTSGTSDTVGGGTNTSQSLTAGDSRTLTIEHQDKAIEVLLESIDDQLKRIKSCEAFGVWECAAYFIADDIQTSVVASNAYKALMSGDQTGVENSFVNIWGFNNTEQTRQILEYLKCGRHPVIRVNPVAGYSEQLVTPGNYISGKELPLLMGLPQKSVSGLTVSSIAMFGRNVFIQNARALPDKVHIGNIYHMGAVEPTNVELDLNSFSSHCFITGSTGSGKSNTTYCLIERFIEHHIPFMVIEPAKGEYKEAFGAVPGIHIFTTNPLYGEMLKINPFRFDSKIHILEHLDRLIEIFNACWEMYAAMPAILKEAIERIYIDKGWDLLNSIYIGNGEPNYPTFRDLMNTLPEVINKSSYSAETKGDYTGALVTRVSSLTNGISGQIFCDNYDITDSELFDENTIADLSRVGSTETKSLIMGMMVLKLSEYRMAHAEQANHTLRHITVLEEAHNLLKRPVPGAAGSVVTKSVEMICNSIAEMRTYGEGFIIVDQSPNAVDIAAIKNTNTKILMRLPEKNDCIAVGNSVGLNEEQTSELSKLSTGIAVIMQNNWLEAVLTRIDKASDKYEKRCDPVEFEQLRKLRGAVVEELLKQYVVDREMNFTKICDVIDQVDISAEKKKEMKRCTGTIAERLSKGRDIDYFCESIINIAGVRNLFDITEKHIKPSKEPEKTKYDRKSVIVWKSRVTAEIKNYIEIPDEYISKLINYLVHGKEMDQGRIDYTRIYDVIHVKGGTERGLK